ncbi:MAG: hypothetical protein IIA66_12685, partial [Planctomycetes bacterium]|nr:hypothetical protein [Planctomycetota bacterium]
MKKPSTPRRRIPKYRRQKRKKCADQAFVELDERRYYFGEYGTPESIKAYDRVIA